MRTAGETYTHGVGIRVGGGTMTGKRCLVALAALCAALAGCGASKRRLPPADSEGGAGDGAGPTGGSATSGAGDSATGGSAAAGMNGAGAVSNAGRSGLDGGGTGAGSGGSAGNSTCTPGVPATSQVPRMKNAAYDNVVRDLLGLTALTSAQGKKPSEVLYPDSDGPLVADAWRLYQDRASTIAHEVMTGPNRSYFLTCDAASTECVTNTIKSFGRKAFRRPLTDAEVTSFLRLTNATPPGTPDEVAEAILFTFLASPSFIMLPELGQETQGDAIKLTDYELATRLSFLLWNSVPDDALNDAADNGQLETTEQIVAQARRLLGDERAKSVFAAFGRAYLGVAPGSYWLNNLHHDTTRFPQFSDAVVAPMLGELDLFFEDVTHAGGSFSDLFLSNVAFVNRDTAPLYGLDAAPFTSDPTRVELDANVRPGVLTRVAFLSTFSHYDVTAPVLRGAFITKSVLGMDPGPAHPNELLPAPGQYRTEREHVEAITSSSATCEGCHQYLDPPGFVLEHYDAVGSWQEMDPLGGPIDATADVILSDGDKQTITSPVELMRALAGSSAARRQFAEQLVAYASGRAPNAADACTVDDLARNMTEDAYAIRELFVDYTRADSFRLRSVGN